MVQPQKNKAQSKFGASFRLPLGYNSGQLSGRGFGGIEGIWGIGRFPDGDWGGSDGVWTAVVSW